jgi:two-component system OmpR family response regulator
MQPKQIPHLKRILYIEDDEDTREMVSFLLTRSNYQITSADNCLDGLKLARQRSFDLYLIDHTLVDGSGIDLCRQIRRFDPKTPIIFCSGYTDDEHQQAALDCGAQQFLSKPFDADQLVALIERQS